MLCVPRACKTDVKHALLQEDEGVIDTLSFPFQCTHKYKCIHAEM